MKQWLTFLLLAAAYPLFFIAHNLTSITLTDAIGVWCGGLLLALCCYVAGLCFGRQHARAASLLLLASLLFVMLHHLLVYKAALALALLVLVGLAVAFLPATRIENRLLLVFGVTLCSVNVALLAWGLFVPASLHEQPLVQQAIHARGNQQDALPHVLYIVPDRYPSAQTLQQEYNFDNSAFLNGLKALGFKVSDNSHANYTTTFPSLVSVLNMNYLPEIVSAPRYVTNENHLVAPFNRNAVFDIFNAIGYQSVFMGGEWQTLHHMQSASKNISLFIGQRQWLSNYARMFIDETPLRFAFRAGYNALGWTWLNGSIGGDKLLWCNNPKLQEKMALKALAEEQAPQFIFWHLYLPHPPYIHHSKHESCVNQPTPKNELMEKNQFIEQLKYTNMLLLRIAQQAQATSNRPVIVVFQSDEGPYPWFVMKRSPVSFDDMKPDEMQMKFGNLNAISMPAFPAGFTMPATPVNNFRLLFNAMIGTQFPMLEDKIWLKHSDMQPNRMRDVTSELKR